MQYNSLGHVPGNYDWRMEPSPQSIGRTSCEESNPKELRKAVTMGGGGLIVFIHVYNQVNTLFDISLIMQILMLSINSTDFYALQSQPSQSCKY